MKGKIEYSNEEVEAIVLAHHERVMPAPAGKHWACDEYYGGAELRLEDNEPLPIAPVAIPADGVPF